MTDCILRGFTMLLRWLLFKAVGKSPREYIKISRKNMVLLR